MSRIHDVCQVYQTALYSADGFGIQEDVRLVSIQEDTKHPVKHHMGYPPSFFQSYEAKSRTESLSMMLECYYWYQTVAYSGSSVVTCPLPTYRDPWDILVATCSLSRCSLSGEMLEPTSERLREGRGRDG